MKVLISRLTHVNVTKNHRKISEEMVNITKKGVYKFSKLIHEHVRTIVVNLEDVTGDDINKFIVPSHA